MAERFEQLSDELIEFIDNQHLFFVGTAGAEGMINVSPKGMDTLRVLGPNELVWLNLTGSGNETAAHVAENQRMTMMFCSFDRQPMTLRLYGTADIVHARDEEKWDKYLGMFDHQPGTRQFFELHIDMVQTSCGYAVPFYEMKGDRPTLRKWAENKGEEGIAEYWEEKNQVSLDGKPTYIVAD